MSVELTLREHQLVAEAYAAGRSDALHQARAVVPNLEVIADAARREHADLTGVADVTPWLHEDPVVRHLWRRVARTVLDIAAQDEE